MSETVQQLPAMLTPHEAAEMLQISTRTLARISKPRGPVPCVRLGPRIVRYRPADITSWIERQATVGEASDATQPAPLRAVSY